MYNIRNFSVVANCIVVIHSILFGKISNTTTLTEWLIWNIVLSVTILVCGGLLTAVVGYLFNVIVPYENEVVENEG